MFQTTRLCRGLALAFGGCLALCALGASAQEQQLGRVEVTGSSIKRVESETALPVTVITREQIERSGATNVEALLQRVTASAAMQSDTTQGAGYATSNANMRGLGANSTLVLLNGRRLANHPFGSIGGTVAVDLNSIPFAAIERIEVLRDGASAVYGTDAVGGVINFITRRDYTKGELSVRYGAPQQNIGGKESGVTLSYGMGDIASDGYNLLLTGNYQKNTRIRAVDQGYYNRGIQEIPGSDPPTSGRAFPGRLVDYNLSPGAYRDATFTDPTFAPCDPVNTVVVTAAAPTPSGAPLKRCRFIYSATLDNLPDQDKYDIFGRFTKKISNDMEFFAEASFAQNHNIGRVAPVPIDSTAGHLDPTTALYPSFAIPVTSKYFPAALLTSLGYTVPTTGMAEVSMRAVPVGNRINDNTNQQTRLQGGFKGTFSGWDYDTALTYARGTGDLKYFGYINEPKFIAALATGNINPFGPNDAAGDALLRTTLMEGPMRQSTSTTTVLDGKASRELMPMAGGNLAVAAGFDLRREQANDHPVNADYSAGLHIGGEGSVPETNASRNVIGVFGELSAPFAKGFEAGLAARFDRYSDFGSTFNPRASLRWQPDKTMLLRASAGTGFRAPSLWDVNSPPSMTNTANSLVDPACPIADDSRCESQFNERFASSPNLKPEKSQQFTLGLVFEPTPSISAAVDYWYIAKKDQISVITGDAILTDPALLAKFGSRIHRTPDGFISYIDTPIENLGDLKTSGIDIDVKTRWNLESLGRLTIGLAGTYVNTYKLQNYKDGPYTSYVGTAGDGGSVQPHPRWQHTLSFDLQQGPWGVTLENQFVKGWTEAASLVDANIGVATDYHVKDSSRWNISGMYNGVKNLTVRVGIRNLFDKEPPFTAVPSYGSHAAGYAASFVDPRKRFFYASLGYQFK
ncbi:TonB-dependent receptor plug domain-containing protein [Piscinibacter terrae]|uniref:TonB-dependent receptor n=1 Tax=Piscinibacter terrae TaxID=2496871 RepID=A0A3N7JU20_9BURK|nr:TonB-dependent receptor [Albitalea terrae]RQP22455.1 TonB-dependent receptor [Albitalea terrae]